MRSARHEQGALDHELSTEPWSLPWLGRVAFVAASIASLSCSEALPSSQDAATDSGFDAGTQEADAEPRPDALANDAAPTDFGPTDFGPTDVGPTGADASSEEDATTIDAGQQLIEASRSLVWTQPELLDDPTFVSLGTVMAAISDDGHGGRLLDWTLRRFNQTSHSERAGPALLAEALAEGLGADPSTWSLESAPFKVTAIHNRIDLARNGHCGELRVSLACTHPLYSPFHMIFLFRMLPEAGDATCGGLARRWVRLSGLSDIELAPAARALLEEHINPKRVLLLETVEFTVAPWEWRQWVRTPNPDSSSKAVLPNVFENPPLFQTVDTEGLNVQGSRRDSFLRWLEANADGVDARRVEIPEVFRPRSARAPVGVLRQPLSLEGLDPAILASRPRLRQNLEIVGCPVCHTADAEFVQTTAQRTFSRFYEKELVARAAALEALSRDEPPDSPFGPLQPDPVLPP
ncbi:MAG: hypothetical protein HY791_03950 [Deltaproteobacteria bacterium]|nr:hypothetical protein [Deltaproteobacteria bacterium]